MKVRRHSNNKGERQVRRGSTLGQVKAMARRLKLPFHVAKDPRDRKVALIDAIDREEDRKTPGKSSPEDAAQ